MPRVWTDEWIAVCVCAHACSPCSSAQRCQLQAGCEERMGVLLTVLAKESASFHFVPWKPSVKILWRAICIFGWLWRGWFCSPLRKSRARTLLALEDRVRPNLPPLSSADPPPSTHCSPGITCPPLWPTTVPSLCCVSKSTCWEAFHQASLEFFSVIKRPLPTSAPTPTYI